MSAPASTQAVATESVAPATAIAPAVTEAAPALAPLPAVAPATDTDVAPAASTLPEVAAPAVDVAATDAQHPPAQASEAGKDEAAQTAIVAPTGEGKPAVPTVLHPPTTHAVAPIAGTPIPAVVDEKAILAKVEQKIAPQIAQLLAEEHLKPEDHLVEIKKKPVTTHDCKGEACACHAAKAAAIKTEQPVGAIVPAEAQSSVPATTVAAPAHFQHTLAANNEQYRLKA